MTFVVNVRDHRRFAHQMVVDRGDLEAARLQRADDRLDFRGTQHQVAHHHRRRKRRPRSEGQRRLDADLADVHIEIASRPAVAMDVAGHRLSRLTEDRVDALERIGSESRNSDQKRGEQICLQHAAMI
jgi:hypothetical protein